MISSRHGEILDGWHMEAPRGETSSAAVRDAIKPGKVPSDERP